MSVTDLTRPDLAKKIIQTSLNLLRLTVPSTNKNENPKSNSKTLNLSSTKMHSSRQIPISNGTNCQHLHYVLYLPVQATPIVRRSATRTATMHPTISPTIYLAQTVPARRQSKKKYTKPSRRIVDRPSAT